MKVLAICHWDLSKADAETARKIALGRALVALGVELTLMAPNLGRYPGDPGFDIRYVPALQGRLSAHAYLLGLAGPLARFLRAEEPELVYLTDYTFSLPLLSLLRALGRRVVVEVNGVMVRDAERLGIRDPVRLAVIRHGSHVGLRRADHCIAVSEDVRRYLEDEVGLDPERLSIVGNGVDPSLHRVLDRGECRRELGLPVEAPLVGFIGGFWPWQGLERLIAAAPAVLAERPETRFVLVGDGPERTRIEELVRQAGLGEAVLMPGEVPLADSPRWIGAFDIGVHLVAPGKECSPVKLLCYMACGRPALVTKGVDGFASVADGGCARLVDHGDAPGTAAAILAMLGDSQLRARMGAEGRRRAVTEASWEQRAQETLAILKTLAAPGPPNQT